MTFHWWHVSTYYHGPEVRFIPRVPRSPSVGEDRTIQRISVAPDVDRCLRSITGLKCPEIGYVYGLAEPADGLDFLLPLRHVPDARDTDEAWLLKPNTFQFAGAVGISFNLCEDDAPRWQWEDDHTVYVCPGCDGQMRSPAWSCACTGRELAATPISFRTWAARRAEAAPA